MPFSMNKYAYGFDNGIDGLSGAWPSWNDVKTE